jgi:hypothetical protein
MGWFIDDKDPDKATLGDVFNAIRRAINMVAGTGFSVGRMAEAGVDTNETLRTMDKEQAEQRKVNVQVEIADWEKTGCASDDKVAVMKPLTLKMKPRQDAPTA